MPSTTASVMSTAAPTGDLRRRNVLPWVIVGVLGGVIALSLLGGAAWFAWQKIDAPETHDVAVTFVLFDAASAGSCKQGAGGYSDIGEGNPVTIADESGKVLASGVLSAGQSYAGVGCEFQALLPDVPDDAAQYGTTVGRRGTVTNSRDEMEAQSWKVELSIGDR